MPNLPDEKSTQLQYPPNGYPPYGYWPYPPYPSFYDVYEEDEDCDDHNDASSTLLPTSSRLTSPGK